MKTGACNDNYTILIGILGNILENVFDRKCRLHGTEGVSFDSFILHPLPPRLQVPQSALEFGPNNSGGMRLEILGLTQVISSA